MAGYNELQVGRYNRLAQKFFSMKGAAAVNSVLPEMGFTLAVFHGVENRYLESWERFAGGGTVAAIVGQSSAFNLRNPAASNVIAVVEKLAFSESVNDNAVVLRNGITADLNLINAPTRLDSRSRPNPTLVLSRNNAAPTLGTFVYTVSVSANLTYDLIGFEEQELPLLPGDGLQIVGGVANQAIVAAWVWRERFLEESERT